jgi:hypothetical protein
VRTVVAIQAVTATLAVIALVWVVVIAAGRIDDLVRAREAGCYLLRDVVLRATPPGRHARAVAWLDNKQNPLSDCHAYARGVLR